MSPSKDEQRLRSIERSMKEAAPLAEKLNNVLGSVLTNSKALGITSVSGKGAVRLGFELAILADTLRELEGRGSTTTITEETTTMKIHNESDDGKVAVECGRCRAPFDVEADVDRFSCPRCACLHIGVADALGVIT